MRDLNIEEQNKLNSEEAAFYESFREWMEHPFTKAIMEAAKEKADMFAAQCRAIPPIDDEGRYRVAAAQIQANGMERIANGDCFRDVYDAERDRMRRKVFAELAIARTKDQALEGAGVRDGDTRRRSGLD